ncbi:hypothetical protein HPB52_010160 [Rhipicephalus sanguineus]|uniref:Uncharacterized protein n=1 Tax=Rhipicephalus sanguineus TaxID=34632 RepID=A0A9D4PWM4_RHISA|nr:hypothetical protein HPB52_010160 [Rhipicephalus sanguineus]
MLASVSARSERAHNETVFLMGHFHQQNVIGNGERSTMKFRAGYKYKIATYQTNSHSLPYPYETMCSDYVTLSKKLGYEHYIMQSEIPGLITYVEGHIGMWLGLSILAISSAVVKFNQRVVQHLFTTN